MLQLTTLIPLIAIMPLVAHANTVISLTHTSCNGSLPISSLSGASLNCDGNFSLKADS